MRVLAAMLVISLSPGIAEAAEDASHWLAEGHTLHAPLSVPSNAGHDDHARKHAEDEHGCTALFHVCGCHSPAPSMVSTRIAFERTAPLHHNVVIGLPDEPRRPVDGVAREAFRPPIA